MKEIREFLDYTLFKIGDFTFHVYNILGIVVIFLAARLILWLVKKYLRRKESHHTLDPGKSYAIIQILSYIVYTIALLLAIDSVGIKITVLLAGSTALLLGIGLGVQDFFRDLVSGFIILSEGAVTAGDIVNVDGIIGKVKEVGLRTTTLLTRDDVILIVPNKQFTNGNVINWSQNKLTTRFSISVGVAYGSDTSLVKDLLLSCASANDKVKKSPNPTVIFEDFGDSSLNFSLYFYSDNLCYIEKTKSDIRFEIDRQFRKNKVSIPFPQRDLWIREKPNTK